MEEKTTLDHVLVVLRRRWRLIVVWALLTGVAAVGFSLLQRPEYTASANLLFDNTQLDNAQVDQDLFGTNSAPTTVDPTQQAATNLNLVSLPIVAVKTASALRTTPAVIQSEVSVSAVGESAIAQIAVTDPRPSRAAEIANTYAQQYILFRQQADRANLAAAQALVRRKLAALPAAQQFGSVGQSLQNGGNQLGIMAALQTGGAELVQPASVPSSPSSPDTKRNAVLGLLLGLLLGIGLAFGAERLDRRIRDPSELEDAYGVPLLGGVPDSPSYAAVRNAGPPLPQAETEAFALLRARLRYFNVDRDVRSLLVTSATLGEGKTTVAVGIALAEAVAGNAKVLLVEADLRRPALASLLAINAVPGLAEILSRNCALEAAMREIAVQTSETGKKSHASFTVIPAGTVPPNPAELVESRAMVDLLPTLSERFDLIVIDSPPTSVVPDAIPLLRMVSGTVIVGRIDKTTRDQARDLREQLAKLKSPTLGVVANGVVKSRAYYDRYRSDSAACLSPNGDAPLKCAVLKHEGRMKHEHDGVIDLEPVTQLDSQ